MDTAEPFVALVVYPTDPDAQDRQAANLMRMFGDTVRRMPGFLGSRVFLSEDGRDLVTLTEWADRESFHAFRESDFGQAAVRVTSELRPTPYWLRLHARITPP
jgi:heme-degrading monooxygenase HmoA